MAPSWLAHVKGIKASEKRLKLFESLGNSLNSNGFIYLQETHSSLKDGRKCKDDFNVPIFFSHRESNSCGVAFYYCGTEASKVVNTACDKNGQILILDAELNDTNFLLINSNSNTVLIQSPSSYVLSPLYKNYLKKLTIITKKILFLQAILI